MNFLYPGFLFALFAVAIPIIIHLFNFRSYKTVYFSRVDLLRDIKQETKSKSSLKDILILVFRILTIISLVLAFAQPYIPAKQTGPVSAVKKIIVYIDNSFSAETEGKYGKIIETAKKKALEIIEAHKDRNEFLFITNDFDPKQQHFVSNEQIKDFIVETDISPSFQYLSNVVSKINDLCSEDGAKNTEYNIYIISDFQHASADVEKTVFNPLYRYILLPLEPKQNNNLFIDSVWFESPERPLFQNDELNIRIVNKSEESYSDMPLKLFINGQLKSTVGFTVMPGSDITQKISFSNESTGLITGMVEISDFPVTFDNTFYFNYTIEPNNKVLVSDPKGNNKYFDRIFNGLNYVQIEYADLSRIRSNNRVEFQTLVLNNKKQLSDNEIQDLFGFVSSGGKLLIFVPTDADFAGYNKLFSQFNVNLITGTDTAKTYAAHINYNSRIFKDVFKKKDKNIDFPYILKRVKFSDQTYANEEMIMASENNDKLISSAKFGDGMVYIFSNPADEKSGNLVFHPIWVPMIYNMVIYNTVDEKLFFTVGQENITEIHLPETAGDRVVRIKNPENTIDIIPRYSRLDGKTIKLFWNDELEKAGPYTIQFDETVLKGLSMNYDRKESDLNFYTSNEINDFIKAKNIKNVSVIDSDAKDISEKVRSVVEETKLWKLFLILSLAFLLIEIIIIRIIIFKKQS